MAGSININRNEADPFNRYQMPSLLTKIEGKGNGIKTLIVNMKEIGDALSLPAIYATKYFGCELGTQTLVDAKNGRYIVNGAHDAEKLQSLLDVFIRKFVLCPKCVLPETFLTVATKAQTVWQTCRACDFHGQLRSNHKLLAFILKNPPNAEVTSTASNGSGSGKRTKRKGAGAAALPAAPTAGEQQSDAKAVRKRKESGMRAEWSIDDSQPKVTASQRERIDAFYELVKQQRDANKLGEKSVQQALKTEAQRLDVVGRAPLILAELLFSVHIQTDVYRQRELLALFTEDNLRAQRYLIEGIAKVIEQHADVLVPKVAGLFQFFYNQSILDEQAIDAWLQKTAKRATLNGRATTTSATILRNLQPFLKWLRTAEEEGQSQGDDDDDDDCGVVISTAINHSKSQSERNEVDINIDEI